MTIEAIHQIVPSLRRHDAVGSHTRRLRDAIRSVGLRSQIFSDDVDPSLADEALPITSLPSPGDGTTALIYQCSIGNEVADQLLDRPEPLVVNYHNLTPVGQLLRWAPDMAHQVGWGRSQLSELAAVAVGGVGDSQYNSDELEALGFRSVHTAPVLLDVSWHEAAERRGRDWLFVGRIVPNKAQHDLLAAFAWFRAHHDPSARLRMVGSPAVPRYAEALVELGRRLGVQDAVDVIGMVDDEALDRHYREAGVFVCLSDHEGFCIPLIEAMARGLPVVAFAAAAVPETLGGAGLLLPSKDPVLVASAAARALDDPELAAELRERGRRRVEHFGLTRSKERHLAALRALLGLPPG